jgi:putative ABC transport system substrate-binding protein
MAGPDPVSPVVRAFVHALRDLGYVEGRNLVLERRSAEGRFERAPDIVRELVSIKADVIVAVSIPMIRAAKTVTQTVPIVMLAGNPVEEGLVQSLARPGGNITGVSHLTSVQNAGKRVELLKEIIPTLSRVAHLQSKQERAVDWDQAAEAIERQLGVKVLIAEHTPTDYSGAFESIVRERANALLVAASAANLANRNLIVEFAAKNRLPAIYPERQSVDAGGLISYGPDLPAIFRRLAEYVDRILKGANAADLPIEQPTKFQLVVNLKAARALGLNISPTLLARADEVIE